MQLSCAGRGKIPAFVTIYTFASSLNYFFAKDAISSNPPLLVMTLRYLIAGTVFAALITSTRNKFDKPDTNVLYLGIFTAASTGFWVLGLRAVSPAESAVLSYTMPFFAISLSGVILHERPSCMASLGLTVGFAGITLNNLGILLKGGSVVGASLTLINAFFWAAYTVMFRKLRSKKLLSTNMYQFLFGSLMLFLSCIVMREDYPLKFSINFVLDVLYISLVGGVGTFIIWNLMLRELRTEVVSSFAFGVPLVTLFIDAVVLSHVFTTYELAGSILIITGVFLTGYKRSRI